jgi:hypothetical protein
VVCEGIPDALIAGQAGFCTAGILGSQAPDEAVSRSLTQHAERHGLAIVAVVDADPAGRRWGERLGELVASNGHGLQIIEPPDDGVDLNDWALTDPDWASWINPPNHPDLGIVMPFDQASRAGVEIPSP